MSIQKKKLYFRLLDKNYLPALERTNPKKATVSLIKDRKYIYLDMNSTNGFKAMQNCQSQSDEDDQKLGKFVVCEGSRTSREKLKLKQFLTINHQTKTKKNDIRNKIKLQLDKSRDKFVRVNKSTLDKPRIYAGLDNQKFQRIRNTIETDKINQNILRRQEMMVQKLGIISDFQSINDRSTPSFNQKLNKAEKYFLPKILKDYQ